MYIPGIDLGDDLGPTFFEGDLDWMMLQGILSGDDENVDFKFELNDYCQNGEVILIVVEIIN